MLTPVRLFLVVLLLAAPAAAQRVPSEATFDPARLDPVEIRFVQAALAFEGAYDGLLDSVWGPGSRDAFAAWARRATGSGRPSWNAMARLVRGFDTERRRSDWAQLWHTEEQVGHLMPSALVSLRDSRDGLNYATPNEDLEIGYVVERRDPSYIHETFVIGGIGNAPPYRMRDEALRVSAGRTRDGLRSYIRSDRVGDRWATHVVVAEEEQAGRLRVIAGSLSRRQDAPLDPPSGGVLAGLIDGTLEGGRGGPDAAPRPDRSAGRDPLESVLGALLDRALEDVLRDERAPERPAREPQQPRDEPVRRPRDRRDRNAFAPGAATGFRINTTDIVTSADLVDRCGRIETVKGEPLDEVAVDGELGVAVLASAGRSSDWLSVSTADPSAGTDVTLVGRLENGAVIRDGRLHGGMDGRRIRHGARVGSPMNGAPILDPEGRVVGVTLPPDRHDDLALPSRALAAFLDDVGVPYHDNSPDRFDRPARRATVALRCAGRR